jgi:hypothetical protein
MTSNIEPENRSCCDDLGSFVSDHPILSLTTAGLAIAVYGVGNLAGRIVRFMRRYVGVPARADALRDAILEPMDLSVQLQSQNRQENSDLSDPPYPFHHRKITVKGKEINLVSTINPSASAAACMRMLLLDIGKEDNHPPSERYNLEEKSDALRLLQFRIGTSSVIQNNGSEELLETLLKMRGSGILQLENPENVVVLDEINRQKKTATIRNPRLFQEIRQTVSLTVLINRIKGKSHFVQLLPH